MDRLKRRLEKLRSHHFTCEQRYLESVTHQVQRKMAERLRQGDDASENQDVDSSESESSCCTGSDPDHNQPPISPSSSEEEDLGPNQGSSGAKKTQDKDGGSSLLSSKKSLESYRGDESADEDNPNLGKSTERLSKKRGNKQCKRIKPKDGASDLFNPQKSLESYSGDESSDGDDQSLVETQIPSKKRRTWSRRTGAKDQRMRAGQRKLHFLEEERGKRTMKATETNRQLKRPWTDEEKNAVQKHLGRFLVEHRVPGKDQCMRCKEKESVLDERSWRDVKNFVYNTIVTMNRRAAAKK